MSNCLCNNGKSTPTCKCSQCYTIQSDGRVFTFAYGTDGKCEWGGADCCTSLSLYCSYCCNGSYKALVCSRISLLL